MQSIRGSIMNELQKHRDWMDYFIEKRLSRLKDSDNIGIKFQV